MILIMEPAHIPQMIAYCIKATFPWRLLCLVCKSKITSKISSNIAANNWCANGSLSALNIFDNTGIYRMRSKILIATTPIARVIKFFHWRFEIILSLPSDFIKFIARKPYKTLAQRHFYINGLPMDVSNSFFWFPIIHIPAIYAKVGNMYWFDILFQPIWEANAFFSTNATPSPSWMM